MSSVCSGCGFVAEAMGGPSHEYIGSSPECWARYGELLAAGAGGQPSYSVKLLRRAVAHGVDWPWLVQPTPVGTITVDQVLAGRVTVAEWALDVWRGWDAHHPTVRHWLDDLECE